MTTAGRRRKTPRHKLTPADLLTVTIFDDDGRPGGGGGGRWHQPFARRFVVAVFLLTARASPGTQLVRLVLLRIPVPVLFVRHLVHLVLHPFLDHVLLVVVHEPVDVGVLATVHGRPVDPRLARRFPVLLFLAHQHGPRALRSALGHPRPVDPSLLLIRPSVLPDRGRRRRLRIPDRRRPRAATAAVRFVRRRARRRRPLRRRRCRLTLAGLLAEQLVQRMAPALDRGQAGYVHGRMFAVRLLAGAHVDHRVGRLFAARRFHVAGAHAAVLNFRRFRVAGRRPATAGHADELKDTSAA